MGRTVRKRKRAKTRLSFKTQDGADEKADILDSIEVEYVYEPLELPPESPEAAEFNQIFEKFTIQKIEEEQVRLILTKMMDTGASSDYVAGNAASMEDADDSMQQEKPKLSKKKLKQLHRVSIAQLKQLVRRPEIVEWEDTTAKDPKFLVYLKSIRNSVPVPSHWSQKRKYLSGKRGFVKPPFELPRKQIFN